MAHAQETVVAYWLVPAREERELFVSLIRILARQLEAPVFEPHLTLFSARQDRRSAQALLRKFEAKSISLSIRDVQFSAVFTKTLFVRFRTSPELDHLVAGLQRGATVPLKRNSEPHLSLCYKKLPVPAKRELASTIRLPLRRVVFDCVKAVLCPMPMRTAEQVNSWQVIKRKNLSK